MLRDAEFFRSRLSKLDGAGDIGDYVISIVNAKAVAEQTAPPPNDTPSSASTEAQKQREEDGGESKTQ